MAEPQSCIFKLAIISMRTFFVPSLQNGFSSHSNPLIYLDIRHVRFIFLFHLPFFNWSALVEVAEAAGGKLLAPAPAEARLVRDRLPASARGIDAPSLCPARSSPLLYLVCHDNRTEYPASDSAR